MRDEPKSHPHHGTERLWLGLLAFRAFHLVLQTVVVVWNPDVHSRSKRPKHFHDPGLMTHSVAPLCVPGAPEASWPRSAFPASRMSEVSHRLMTASRTSVIPRLLSWRGCWTTRSSTPFPKGAVEVVESEVGHSHAMLAIDGESSNNLEQPEELGHEVIVADLELTEVHEEDTEKHPGIGELDLMMEFMLRGRCARHIVCPAHSPFPAMAATSCKVARSSADSAPSRHFFVTQLCRTKSSQGVAMTWTALTGRRCGAGKSSGTSRTTPPSSPPEQGEGGPTMRKGSYSEELVKHVA